MLRRCCWLLLLARMALAQQPELPKASETIQVTTSRDKVSVQDAPVSITVVDQKQIATSPADNYADLLRGVPGLNVVQTSARDIGIRARGASGVAEHRQLTLLDGRSIYLDFYGVVLWDFLPVNVDEVNQIEVQRGPGSALWGANALSGVVNVRTKSPRELAGGSVSLGIGQIGTRQASVLWAQAFDRFTYKASTSFFEQDAWHATIRFRSSISKTEERVSRKRICGSTGDRTGRTNSDTPARPASFTRDSGPF